MSHLKEFLNFYRIVLFSNKVGDGMIGKIPEELIEKIRTESDIVDVISEYIQLTKEGEIGLDYVLSTVKIHLLFLFLKTNKYSIALVVVQGAML